MVNVCRSWGRKLFAEGDYIQSEAGTIWVFWQLRMWDVTIHLPALEIYPFALLEIYPSAMFSMEVWAA